MAAFGGVNVAAITPRREGPEIDLAAAFELVDFLSGTGVNAIALLGSTGEFVHFSLEERARLTKLAIKRSRVPVIAGVSHSTLDGTVFLAREAADAGAAALLVMPPYFFRYSQEEVRDFYQCFAEHSRNTAPLLLYNIPQFTTGIEPETAAALLSGGTFAGIKDSSGVWGNFMRLRPLREGGSFTLLAGNDQIYTAARFAGADGVISGCACAIPELLVAIDRAVCAGDAPAAWRLDARLHEFIRQVEQFPAPIAIREAVSVRGLKTGPHALPGTARRLPAFREWFQGWLPGVLKESQHA